MRQDFYRLKPILDREDKFAFFDIPKNATQSVVKGTLKKRAIIPKYDLLLWQEKMESYSDYHLNNLHRFAIVRNPWDRLVSIYFYLKERHWVKEVDFKLFVQKIHFGYLPEFHLKTRQHLVSQCSRVMSLDDDILVNYVARLESINKDWEIIASIINAGNKLPVKNISKHEHYKNYYDADMVEMVRKHYSKDIEIFDYEY